MTIQCMRTECWMPKDTDTHSPYVILIAFLLQQWLHYPPKCYVMPTLPVLLFYVFICLFIYLFVYFCQVLAYLVLLSSSGRS